MRWKPFVLASASQFRPGPPPAPDSPERAAEIAEVKNFKRTPVTNAKAFYWQYGQYGGAGLLYRLSDEIGRELAEAGLDGNAPRAARAYALVHVAHYEAYIASQDAKFHYWTARPNQFDPSITTVVPNPNLPELPVERGRGRHGRRARARPSVPAPGHALPGLGAGVRGVTDLGGDPLPQRRRGGLGDGPPRRAAFIERAKHDGAEGVGGQSRNDDWRDR